MIFILAVASPAYADLPLVVSNVQAQHVTQSSATITWATTVPTASEVDWGASTQYGLKMTDPKLTTQHTLTVQSPLLAPGITYHFVTKSDNHKGTLAVSNDSIFTTPGTQLQVQVTAQATNKPIAGVWVDWNDKAETTNSSGWAALSDLPSGYQTVVVRYNGTTLAQLVQILPPASQPQTLSLTLDTPVASSSNPLLAGAIVLALTVIGAATVLLIKRLHLRNRLLHKRATRPVPSSESIARDEVPIFAPRVSPAKEQTSKLGMSVGELHNRLFKRDKP